MLAFSLYVFRYNKFIYPISLSSESRYRTPRYARPLSGRVPPLSDLLLPSFTYISVSPLWLCCEYGKRFSTVSETTTNQHPAVHEGCRDTLTSVMVFTKGHGGGGDPIALLLGFLLGGDPSVLLERPHTARYPPCTTKLVADPPPSRSALPVWGVLASVQTAAVSSMRSSAENLWSAPKSVVSPAGPPMPAGRCGARQPLFYASRASRRLCFKEGRYGSRSCGTAESTEGGTSPSDMVPYSSHARCCFVADIRARSYPTA